MPKLYVTTLLLLIALDTTAQMNAGTLHSKNQYVETSWTDVRKSVRVPVKLGETEVDFMVDSGAPCFISAALQQKKQYKVLQVAVAEDSGGNRDSVLIVEIDNLKLGGLEFSGIPALVFDIAKMPFHCEGLEGNFGSNLMRFLVIQFDLGKKKVMFSDNPVLIPEPSKVYAPLMLNDQSDAYWVTTLQAGILDTVHFDSGSASFYEMSFSAAQKFRIAFPASVVAKGFGSVSQGVHGKSRDTTIYLIQPGAMKLGGKMLKNGIADIAVNNRSRMGRSLLNHGVLRLDYRAKQFSFTPFKRPLAPAKSHFGFGVQTFPKQIRVGVVWQDTDAERQGLAPGDEIIALNGKSLQGMDDCAMEEFVRQAFKSTQIQIKLRRPNASVYAVTLKKKQVGKP